MLKRNLFFLFATTIFAILSLILCINNYNPFSVGFFQFIYFYLSFLLTITGFASIVIFYIRVSLKRRETIYIHFWPAVRQGSIIGIGLTVLLMLKGLGLLDIWVSVPIIIIFLLFELFFQTKKSK